jgi:ubiquinone/menaquinone biosynthesis C-methylase UbiE
MERLFATLRLVIERPGAVVLDAGAGSCWLSYRLWERGARPVAIDLNTDSADGLGVAELYRRHKGAEIAVAQAELERLPLPERSCDAVVINGSLHYAASPVAALREGLRILKPSGLLIVMDSPFYRRERAGQMMRREFIRSYTRRTGTRPAPIPGKGYITYAEMRQAFRDLRVPDTSIRLVPQHTGLRALARRAKLILAPRHRELATHPMWVVRRET